MIEIFSPGQMKEIDGRAINKLNVSSLQLMENAGRTFADEIAQHVEFGEKTVIVFCGKGNNGGDGFVAARFLAEKNAAVAVVLLDDPKDFSVDAKLNFKKLPSSISIQIIKNFLLNPANGSMVIVDAIFGTSFRGKADGKYLKAIRWINGQKNTPIFSVDIPSGLNGETGDVETDAVRADYTVTLSNPKIGFYRKNAKDFTGSIVTKGIGIPVNAFQDRSNIFLVEEEDIRNLIPRRASNSHKHSVGKIFVLAGSKGMMGAALMSSQSAMRSGAGQVILGVPDSQYSIVAKRTLEVMPLGLPSTPGGSLSLHAKTEIEKKIEWATIVLAGCGLSQHPETQKLMTEIVSTCPKPVVVDADALNAIANNMSALKKRRSRHVILTPHYGEFSRMTGIASSEIEERKFELARSFAEQYNVVLVLKGAPTITAVPNGNIFVNPTGNPGMSTAGSGDVLSGMIAALFGQGLSAESAAVLGVYLHGLAGDTAREKFGVHGMIAGDIIKQIPSTIRKFVS